MASSVRGSISGAGYTSTLPSSSLGSGSMSFSSTANNNSSTLTSISTSNNRVELARGRSYIGTINAKRKPEGMGTKFDKNGKIIGQCDDWRDGKMNGSGFQLLDTGGKYSGQFLNGLWHGLGLYISEDGSSFEGRWSEGAQNGPGKLTWSNGDISEGVWADNNQIGFGVHWNKEGKIQHMGRYENGPRQSCPIPRRILPCGTFLNKQEKVSDILYPNGDYYVGAYSENLPHGEGKLYNATQKLIMSGQFQNGIHISEADSSAATASGALNGNHANGSNNNSPDQSNQTDSYDNNIAYDDFSSTLSPVSPSSAATAASASASTTSTSEFPATPLHLIVPQGPASLLGATYSSRGNQTHV